MTNTSTDLATDILRRIGRLDAVSEPSAEDSEYIKNLSRREHAQLQKRNVCYWDYDDIPDEVYNTLVEYLGKVASPYFGIAVAEMELELTRQRLEQDARPRYAGETLKSDFPGTRSSVFDFTRGS